MVGLMYLVLMALHMNVSMEIINAFVTLNNKLEGSIEQVESLTPTFLIYLRPNLPLLKQQVLHLKNWLESNSIKIQTILLFHLQGI